MGAMIDLRDALDTFLEAALVARKDRVEARLRPTLQRTLAAAFRKQGRLFVRRLGKLRDQWPVIQEAAIPQQLTFPGWEQEWYAVAAQTTEEFVNPVVAAETIALTAGGNALYRDMSLALAFDVANPLAERYLYEHGAKMVTGMNYTTQGYIRTIISDGLQKGQSYDTLAKTLLDRFEEFAIGKPQQHIASRAHLISITEIGNAYEAGNGIVAKNLEDAGLEMEKSWLTSRDSLVSDGCQENQDQGWIPRGELFQSGHMQPLRFPGCRCAALYRRVRR